MKGKENHKVILTVDEAAQLLGLARNSAYQGVLRGEIPSIRIGRRILIPRIALERMLNQAGDESKGTGL
ncbi:helix-turn-helix domain-containing protein [Chloroflexota bacterium]